MGTTTGENQLSVNGHNWATVDLDGKLHGL